MPMPPVSAREEEGAAAAAAAAAALLPAPPPAAAPEEEGPPPLPIDATSATLACLVAAATATRAHLAHDLRSRTHSSATVLVELKDHSGQLVFAGHFDWLISRTSPAA